MELLLGFRQESPPEHKAQDLEMHSECQNPKRGFIATGRIRLR